MDIKEFYIRNKYSINGVISVLIFIVALIPMYFLYNTQSNYPKIIEKEKIIINNDIKAINKKISKSREDIKLKNDDIQKAKDESQKMAEDSEKYPQDDRKTAIFSTRVYLLEVTSNIEVIRLEAKENGIVPGEIEQIPFILECRGDYINMIGLLNRINEKKFIYIKDINIKLDGNVLAYNLEIVTLARKTDIKDVVPNIETPTQTQEIKIVMRSDNPFGSTASSEQQPVIPTDNPVTTPDLPYNEEAPSNNNNQQPNIERLYPLDVDAELLRDYNEKKNIIDDNLSNFSHSISLKTSAGTEVKSVKNGKVIFVGKLGTHGNSIMIEHQEGNISYYGNLGNVTVYKGQSVNIGKVIGYTGGAGDLSVPHLNFGYTIDGQFVDPKQFMNMSI
ncbi:MAG TPA: hypothetical protein DEP72_00070 [Clostridiales bacterium]|nr:MAG: hypothetical protein A2Y18_08390 [Clostridiales bacterium GWD2_32_19]HCC06547.1 hypothetical protein [Clostridiales bacterium]